MRRIIPQERLKELHPSGPGLSDEQAEARRQSYGPNNIIEVAYNPWIALILDTFRDPMIWYLGGISILYAVLGNNTEAITLILATLPLIGMDIFLHRRTQASTESLSRQLANKAWVCRNGEFREIPALELVPGDRVRVGTGESFPADGLIIQGTELQADEASLTGESLPAHKNIFATNSWLDSEDLSVESDRWGLAGTRLLTGEAIVHVVFTGQQTLYGEIVRTATRSDKARTPVQAAIGNLVTLLIVISAVLCLILAAGRWRQGHDWTDSLVSAATLAVAALPDEYPVVFTVFLGVGVYRLAKRKALVRRGVSVENIGRVSCICTDKTGTLTQGRLRLEHLLPVQGLTENGFMQMISLASRRETGDPMDIAILDRLEQEKSQAPKAECLRTFPFTEQRRRETAVVRLADELLAVTKGSPEILLAMSDLSTGDRTLWMARADEFAAGGHRVLACVRWRLEATWAGGEPDQRGQFMGLMACEDPLRDGVTEALGLCRDAGIRVIMVTGDHPSTARCIAKEMGLGGNEPGVILGDVLAERLERSAANPLAGVDVVARAMPAQKLALVKTLQAEGEIVAVTGDGVNDVPALQAADVGLAMGERGTRSAREVASIVLLDDDFSTIVQAIAEGRQLFRNLRRSFQYLLIIHIPLVITAALIPLMGYPLLYLPVHIVWIELIIHPTALLVFQELPTSNQLTPVVRNRKNRARFFSVEDWLLIALIGSLLTALVVFSFDRSLQPNGDVPHARAMALVALTCASAALTAVLSRLKTLSAWIMTVGTLGLSALLVQVPYLAGWLHISPLHWDDWGIALAGGFLCVLVPMVLFQHPGPRSSSLHKRVH